VQGFELLFLEEALGVTQRSLQPAATARQLEIRGAEARLAEARQKARVKARVSAAPGAMLMTR